MGVCICATWSFHGERSDAERYATTSSRSFPHQGFRHHSLQACQCQRSQWKVVMQVIPKIPQKQHWGQCVKRSPKKQWGQCVKRSPKKQWGMSRTSRLIHHFFQRLNRPSRPWHLLFFMALCFRLHHRFGLALEKMGPGARAMARRTLKLWKWLRWSPNIRSSMFRGMFVLGQNAGRLKKPLIINPMKRLRNTGRKLLLAAPRPWGGRKRWIIPTHPNVGNRLLLLILGKIGPGKTMRPLKVMMVMTMATIMAVAPSGMIMMMVTIVALGGENGRLTPLTAE